MKANTNYWQKIVAFLPWLALFVLYIAVRFYKLESRINFDWDQNRDAMVAWDILKLHKLTLLGPRVVGAEGFFLAPYYYYLLVPFYAFLNMSPYAIVLFLFAVQFAYFFLAVYVIGALFSRKIAFVFLLLSAVPYNLLSFDTTAWNPALIPLGVLCLWLLLFQSMSQNHSLKWVLFIGFTIGVFTNFHIQFLFVGIFALIFIVLKLVEKKTHLYQIALNFVSFLLGFFLTFLPLLFFDLRHNFLNSKLIIRFFLHDETVVKTGPKAFFPVLTNFMEFLTFAKYPFLLGILLFLLGVIMIKFTKDKQPFTSLFSKASLFMFTLTFLGFAFYQKRPSEYYFYFLAPYIFLFLSLALTKMPRIILIIFLIIYYLFNLSKLWPQYAPSMFGLKMKNDLVQTMKAVGEGKHYNVTFRTPPGRNFGYEYLLLYNKINSTNDWSDPLMEITSPPTMEDIPFGEYGLFIPKELR